ncbi:MAG: DUF302 domain-containing protein [Cyanobacteria bacterium P01_A01_bin.3]
MGLNSNLLDLGCRVIGVRALGVQLAAAAIAVGSVTLLADRVLAQTGLITVDSPYTVEETVARLEAVVAEKELTLFGIVDHAAGAASVDAELPPTQVVIFGNPAAGTPLMQCAPTVAIDLPLKALIWEVDGQTQLAYNDMSFLQERHEIEGCDEVLSKIAAALNGIVTEVTQS